MGKAPAPRLAVPCGTHCWLPPWHLPFPAPALCVLLFVPSQLCAIAQHRHAPIRSAALIIGRGESGRALDGQGARRGEGRQVGPLRLSIVTGNGAPRTRRGEAGGASSPFSVFVHFYYPFVLIQVIEYEEKWRFPKRDGALSVAQIFLELYLANWPPRQTVSPPPLAPPCCLGTLSAITASLCTPA